MKLHLRQHIAYALGVNLLAHRHQVIDESSEINEIKSMLYCASTPKLYTNPSLLYMMVLYFEIFDSTTTNK